MTAKKSKQISLGMNEGGVASAAAISDGFRPQNGDQSFPSPTSTPFSGWHGMVRSSVSV